MKGENIMIYGYARVSSKDQKLDRQIAELLNFGVASENIILDKQNKKRLDRRMQKCHYIG